MRDLPAAQAHRLVVDGRTVRVITAGAGQPAVFFDAALGMPLEEWALVAPTVARDTSVVLWDRPGLGRSDPGPPLGWAELLDAMDSILDQLGCGPVIAVGHSLGGLHVLGLALTRPERVCGLVLVEPSHPAQDERMGTRRDDPVIALARSLGRMPWIGASVGLAAAAVDRVVGSRISGTARLTLEVLPGLGDRLDALTAEHSASRARRVAAQAAMAMTTFPAIPLTVITGTKNFTSDQTQARTWDVLHDELAQLSPQGDHVRLDCGHGVPVTNPRDVVTSIHEMWNRQH